MKSIVACLLLVVCAVQIQSGVVPLSYHTYDVNPTCEHPFYSPGTYAYSPYYRHFPTGYYQGACGCSSCKGAVASYVAPYYLNAYNTFVV